jgi:hypothetical protein
VWGPPPTPHPPNPQSPIPNPQLLKVILNYLNSNIKEINKIHMIKKIKN